MSEQRPSPSPVRPPGVAPEVVPDVAPEPTIKSLLALVWGRARDDDDEREAPPQVVTAGSLGIAPLPFLAVYAVLFISHGTFHPVVPPDITTTKHGELLAGLIALALLVVGIISVVWFMSGRRRWLFVVGQAATLVTCVDFLIDRTTGSPIVPVILLATSAVALVLALLPQSTAYLRT